MSESSEVEVGVKNDDLSDLWRTFEKFLNMKMKMGVEQSDCLRTFERFRWKWRSNWSWTLRLLEDEVSVVFHNAATVKFNEDLDKVISGNKETPNKWKIVQHNFKPYSGNGHQRWRSVLSGRACKEDEEPESLDPCLHCILQHAPCLVSYNKSFLKLGPFSHN